MVISFSFENVRDHLLQNGIVYTLRDHPHKTGKDWANSGRRTKKIADVLITEIPFAHWSRQHVEHSGFTSKLEWGIAYCKLNNDPEMRKAHLYKVEVILPSYIERNGQP